jgi:hypothetical protein
VLAIVASGQDRKHHILAHVKRARPCKIVNDRVTRLTLDYLHRAGVFGARLSIADLVVLISGEGVKVTWKQILWVLCHQTRARGCHLIRRRYPRGDDRFHLAALPPSRQLTDANPKPRRSDDGRKARLAGRTFVNPPFSRPSGFFFKGKNFSCNNLGQRKKSDFYETPYSITRHLLANEPFDRTLRVCEPACGNGAIVRILQQSWDRSKITAYDKDRDFLKDRNHYDYIITNPPFSLAYDFILRAKRSATKKFAFLLPLNYLHGKKRYNGIYQDIQYGLRKVHVFIQYPLLGEPLREDGKYRTGMLVYAWYVFQNHYAGLPTISWLDNNDDVLSVARDTVAPSTVRSAPQGTTRIG